jgi:hypothetical protein
MKVVSTDSQKFNAVVRVGGDWTCVVALDQRLERLERDSFLASEAIERLELSELTDPMPNVEPA